MGASLLVKNIGELVTMKGGVRRGERMRDPAILHDAAVSIVEGRIQRVGLSKEVEEEVGSTIARHLDAEGRAVVPGLVDPHTHAIFAGDRKGDLDLRSKGLDYSEILAQGGGILETVRKTRGATPEDLSFQLRGRLDEFLEHGTTTVEIKTGYGLDLRTELSLLKVLRGVSRTHPIDIVPTFLGAHTVPPEFSDPSSYSRYVALTVLPRIAELAEFVDVFCDRGAIDPPSARIVLEEGRRRGLGLKIHADEIERIGALDLAVEMGVRSADHLIHSKREDLRALSKSSAAGVLLPTSALSLGKGLPDARAVIEEGVPLALGTDFSPNVPCSSLALVLSLSTHALRLSPSEALAAGTINAAYAIGREEEVGSIEPGKKGDLLVLDSSTYVDLLYRPGARIIRNVVKEGEIVVGKGFTPCS